MFTTVCLLNYVQLMDVWELYIHCVHVSHVLLWILEGQDQNLSHLNTLDAQHECLPGMQQAFNNYLLNKLFAYGLILGPRTLWTLSLSPIHPVGQCNNL